MIQETSTIRRYILVGIAILCGTLNSAQIYAQTPRLGLKHDLYLHQIQFTNSLGERLDYTRGLTSFLGVDAALVYQSGWSVSAGVSGYRLNSVYTEGQIQSELDLGFLRPSIDLSYGGNSAGSVHLYAGCGLGYSLLIQGTQTINGSLVDLRRAESLGDDLNVSGILGLTFTPKQPVFFQIGYAVQQSIINSEQANTNQVTKYFFHGISTKMGIEL